MSEGKHTATPGPYMVATLEGTETLCVATEGGGVIAVMGGAPRRWIEKDAELLASAPDLLEALELIDAWDPEQHVDGMSRDALAGMVNRMGAAARAAISKAKGDV